MSYTAPLGDTYIPPASIAAGDFGAMATNQRNEAYKRYGGTSITQPGRTDKVWPNMSGDFAVAVIDFWVKELNRLSGVSAGDVARAVAYAVVPPVTIIRFIMWAVKPGSAAQTAWERAVNTFRTGAPGWKSKGRSLGDNLMPEATASQMWLAIAMMAERMRGVAERPSDWQIFGESVKEVVKDYKEAAEDAFDWTKKIVMFGAIGLAALFLLNEQGARR